MQSQAGFTLLETTIALALLTAMTVVSIVALTHRGGAFIAGREQIVAFLVQAKAHAETNGDADGNTGATVTAHYEPVPVDATTLTLYDGRPFAGLTPTRARGVAPLRVSGRLSLAGAGANANDVALFFGTSGATSAVDQNLAPGAPLAEPACDAAAGIIVRLVTSGTSGTIVLSCMTGEVVPDSEASPNA